MSLTVDFSNEVRDWIAHNLTRGCAPETIVEQLLAHGIAPELASAMVRAVSNALVHAMPMPEGTLTLGEAEPQFVPAPSRLPAGPSFDIDGRRIRVLARMQRPVVAVLANVLDAEECDALIEAAKPRLRASTVVDPLSGKDRIADHRSSEGMFFGLGESPLIARIERRIAVLTGKPVENGEGLQLLRYPVGAESTPHFDYLMPTNDANRESVARSGQRISTLILYLNDVPEGGETCFPHLGLSVVPQRGHALYFEYANDEGHTDPLSLHAGAPVLAGEKWIATKWTRQRKFVAAAQVATYA